MMRGYAKSLLAAQFLFMPNGISNPYQFYEPISNVRTAEQYSMILQILSANRSVSALLDDVI